MVDMIMPELLGRRASFQPVIAVISASTVGSRSGEKASRGTFAVALAAILLVLSGCGDDAVISRFMLKSDRIIVERRPDPGCRRDLCWNLIGAVSDWMRIRGQAARSIGLSASFCVRLCHPSTLRRVI